MSGSSGSPSSSVPPGSESSGAQQLIEGFFTAGAGAGGASGNPLAGYEPNVSQQGDAGLSALFEVQNAGISASSGVLVEEAAATSP